MANIACSKLSACLLNISEAKNRHLVEQIAKAGIVKAFSKNDQDKYMKTYLEGRNSRASDHVPVSMNVDVLKQLRAELFGTRYSSQTAILNIFSDPIYNRSVITIAGTLPGVEKGVTAACIQAFQSLEG